MIVGWRQWADAGAISSGLPNYLISQINADKIGRIKSDGFYLFQFPGTHHYLRPEIKLEDGYQTALTTPKNEIFISKEKGLDLLIFLGDEPHLNVERYADAFFDLAETLNVKKIAAVGGVYGAVPYDKDREISCAYSLKPMKQVLAQYAVKFSNYEGGATIGSYLLDQAEHRNIEFTIFYAFVPAYDLSQISSELQGVRIENDYKAWYDLMRRLNHLFGMSLELSNLEQLGEELVESMATKVQEIEKQMPNLNVKAYLETMSKGFTERTFMPLDDVWERELGDLLEDLGSD